MTHSTASLTDIPGIGAHSAKVLTSHGFSSINALAEADSTALAAVPGFKATRAATIIAAAKECLANISATPDMPTLPPTPPETTVEAKTQKTKKTSASKPKSTSSQPAPIQITDLGLVDITPDKKKAKGTKVKESKKGKTKSDKKDSKKKENKGKVTKKKEPKKKKKDDKKAKKSTDKKKKK